MDFAKIIWRVSLGLSAFQEPYNVIEYFDTCSKSLNVNKYDILSFLINKSVMMNYFYEWKAELLNKEMLVNVEHCRDI